MSSNPLEHKVGQLDNDVSAIYEMIATVQITQRRHDNRFKELAEHLQEHDARFDGVDARFDGVDSRFDGVDSRFVGIDDRLEGIDDRLEGIDGRLEGIDGRLEGIDGRLEGLGDQIDTVLGLLREH